MTSSELARFVEKYQLAQDAALSSHYERGTSGLEVEWNVINAAFRPLLHVGAGPDARSFVEALRERFIPTWLADRNALEVFHWMTEWVTRPYYHPLGAVYEARVLEGCLLNALHAAGLSFGERLFAWPGNVLWPIEVGHDAIPSAWSLAKRRYLERCVDLFGSKLATAGVHVNVSLPEPLFSLDFLHQPPDVPQESSLVAFRNAAYIRGARVLRAFSALFIATTANSPLRGEWRDEKEAILLTDCDSNRLAQFPNPPALDVPRLYRSHADYVWISTDLVRRRIRFGNNNWTPTRARSDVASVAHIIDITTDQLHDVYLKGIYGVGEQGTVEQLAQRIEIENMVARVELPMARVEVRSDEGGHSLELDCANLVLTELLLIWSYANPSFGASFAYEAEDIARVRRNEAIAAEHGLRGEIEHPFTHRTRSMRAYLQWTLEQVRPLATALGWQAYLEPLESLAGGAPNGAEALRERLHRHCTEDDLVPPGALHEIAADREQHVARDLELISERLSDLGDEAPKLRSLVLNAANSAKEDPSAPIRFQPRPRIPAGVAARGTTAEIVELSQELIRIPSVTNCPDERLADVHRAARFIAGYLRDASLEVRLYDRAKYPAVLARFPGRPAAPVMLSGHFDVVAPSPDDRQFNPQIEGDYLWGRGAADMKTVVATYLVWMRDMVRRRPSRYPPINLLLVGNEENGEAEPVGTPHVLAELENNHGYRPELFIAGERTGEGGDELFGEICIENRGVVRLELTGHGVREHTGVGANVADLGAKIVAAREAVGRILHDSLTLDAPDGWKTEYRFPFITVGQPGVYNITADIGQLGLEIRPIPQDDVASLLDAIRACAQEYDLELKIQTKEPGVACRRDNPYLRALIAAVRITSGSEPILGRKKPGTSGRFAPDGQAVIWGQTGIGPHSPAERHYLPSIQGYYDALNRFADLLLCASRKLCPP
ncbi:MAG: M20/M25/M40 family metallo-hydrolase [Phycisphaerae bacterium]